MQKNILWSVISIFFMLSIQGVLASDLVKDLSKLRYKITESFDDIYEEKSSQDPLVEELYAISGRLYQNIVEVTALYYCGNFYGNADMMQSRLMLSIGKDMIDIIRVLAFYIPVVLKSSEFTFAQKAKKVFQIAALLCFVIFCIKEYYTEEAVEVYRRHSKASFDGNLF